MALFGKRVRIGDLLLSQGMITQQQLDTALSEQKIRKTKLGETLIALGYVSQKDFSDVLSRQLGVESVDLRKEGLQDAAIRLVPEDIMKKYELVPFAIDENNSNILKIAMSDPMYLPAIDDVSLITGMCLILHRPPRSPCRLTVCLVRSRRWRLQPSISWSMRMS